jgi:hypothetical protein
MLGGVKIKYFNSEEFRTETWLNLMHPMTRADPIGRAV